MKLFLFAALPTLLLLTACESHEGRNAETAEKHASSARPKQTGEAFVELSPAEQSLAGIRTQELSIQSWTPQIVAYGHLEEDPSSSFVLRAPITGTLSIAPEHNWPAIGDHLQSGVEVGKIEPLFTPNESIGLKTQLATAQSDVQSAKASVTAAQTAYDRARILNADQKNVADRVVQESEARLQSEEARYRAAAATEHVLATSLEAGRPLLTEQNGEVAEILAQPGESVQAGVPILRVARFNHLLARINVPVGEQVLPNLSIVRIVPAGSEDQPGLRAERLAVSATVDPNAQGTSFLFRLLTARFGLRPGVAVTAFLPSTTSAQLGMVIPQSAVVRVEAKPYVYVQTGATRFERRQVSVDDPREDGYFVNSGFAPGNRIVTVGAQTLLSQEFKTQMKGDES